MKTIASLLTALVALIHVYILVLEMFLWETPRGMKAFGTTPQIAADSAVLAANQGLYNGFLAAGLIWALLRKSREMRLLFLTFVLIAGIYGALTASMTILYVQALPALAALIFTLISKRG